MIDIEVSRNMKLIEEREDYENDFISIEDILKSEELDYYTTPNYEEYFLKKAEDDFIQDLDWEFELEDCLSQLRDERMIEAHMDMDEYPFEIDLDIAEYDPLGAQIKSLEYGEDITECEYWDDNYYDFDDFYDYEDPIEDYFYFESHKFERNSYLEASYCGGNYLDYMPHDDIYFRIDGCDYPEGPD